MKIGFIGLGIMGKPMAKNMIKAGVSLLVSDLSEPALAELESLGAKRASYAEIGEHCDIVFTILPNGPIVQSVLFSEDGVASTLKKGALVVDMSSVTPSEAQACGEKLAALGAGFLDSPVSGGEPKAIDGTLSFMVGGSEADFEKAQPYFAHMGASSVLVGPVGSGCVTKLTNQVIVNLTIAAVSEGFVLAAKAGADPVKVFEAIRGGLAGSAVLDAKIPMIVERNFKPGGTIAINHKDIKNVLATAHEIDVPMPMTSQLFELQQALKVAGHFNDDHGGYVQYFEKLAGVEVKKK